MQATDCEILVVLAQPICLGRNYLTINGIDYELSTTCVPTLNDNVYSQ